MIAWIRSCARRWSTASRRNTKHPAPLKRTTLNVEMLETRASPAALFHAATHPNRPVLPPDVRTGAATFIDPTTVVVGGERVFVGSHTYVAPFAFLAAGKGAITIGSHSNIQDNVLISAVKGHVLIGNNVILAHNATILGPARVGAPPRSHGGDPAFVGFNAQINGATVQPGAMVSSLARIGPGVVIRSGVKVLPGKLVRTQAEADDPALGKVTEVTEADREFMAGVLHVNASFAAQYAQLFREQGLDAVSGISANPGHNDFNPVRRLPKLAGVPTSDPTFTARIIGNVFLSDNLARLKKVLSPMDSIRADEGSPFIIGFIERWASRATVHALEETGVVIGNNSRVGYHAVIHGGADDGNHPEETTRIGNNVNIAPWAVVFRSTLGNNVTVGYRAYVDGSQLASGTVVPPRAIIIDNVLVGFVEW